jgi:hypothetical protein
MTCDRGCLPAAERPLGPIRQTHLVLHVVRVSPVTSDQATYQHGVRNPPTEPAAIPDVYVPILVIVQHTMIEPDRGVSHLS